MHIVGGVNIYLYLCVNLLVLVFSVFLSGYVISNQSTSKTLVIHVKPSLNLMPCCIKHTAQQGAAGIKVPSLSTILDWEGGL